MADFLKNDRFFKFTWEIDHAHKRSFLIQIVARIPSLGYKQKHLSCPWFPKLYNRKLYNTVQFGPYNMVHLIWTIFDPFSECHSPWLGREGLGSWGRSRPQNGLELVEVMNLICRQLKKYWNMVWKDSLESLETFPCLNATMNQCFQSFRFENRWGRFQSRF